MLVKNTDDIIYLQKCTMNNKNQKSIQFNDGYQELMNY